MATTPSRSLPLDRDQVAQVALDVLDDVGLDGLTVRRLAERLGVQAPALYWHFENKQDLLDLMAHAMTRPWLEALPESAADRDWTEWLADVGRSYRALLLEHRDGARLVASTRPLPDSLPLLDRCVAALEEASGCSPAAALQCLTAITAFVRGFVLDEAAEKVRIDDERGVAARGDEKQSGSERPASPPHLAAAIDAIGSPNGIETFEYGLRLLVDGIRIALSR